MNINMASQLLPNKSSAQLIRPNRRMWLLNNETIDDHDEDTYIYTKREHVTVYNITP